MGGANVVFHQGRQQCWMRPFQEVLRVVPTLQQPLLCRQWNLLWETDAETSCTDALDLYYAGKDPRELFGVEYIYGGKKGEIRSVCHVTNPDEFVAGEEPELLKFDVEVTYCGEKCCIYEKL